MRLFGVSNWAFLGVGVSSDGYRSVIGSNIVHAVSTPKSQMRKKVGARSPGEPGHTVPVRHRGSTLYRYFVPAPPGEESFYFVHLRKGSPRGALAASEARGETTLDVSDSDGFCPSEANTSAQHRPACVRPSNADKLDMLRAAARRLQRCLATNAAMVRCRPDTYSECM